MKFWKKVWKKIVCPGWRFAALSYALFLIMLVFTCTLLVSDLETYGAKYVVYAVTALLLAYCVYISVSGIRRVKGFVYERTEEDSLPGRFVRNYGFRTHVYSGMRLAINVAYALFEGTLALIASSVWYGALAAYHLLLSFMRFFVLNFVRKEGKSELTEEEREFGRAKMYGQCGAMLIVLTLALSLAVVQMVVMKNGFRYAGVMIYAAAAYTTYKVTLAIVNAVKAHRFRAESVRALRNINLADAIVSLLALQTAMLAAFGSESRETFVFNAFTGGAVCLFVVGMGIYMITRSRQKLRKEKKKRGAA